MRFWNWRCLFKPFGCRVVYVRHTYWGTEGYRFVRRSPLGDESVILTFGMFWYLHKSNEPDSKSLLQWIEI